MHRTEATDNNSGLYDETNPATVIGGPAMNALQEEISGAIEESGQTLRSQSADASASYTGQLAEAVYNKTTVPIEYRVYNDRTLFGTGTLQVNKYALNKMLHIYLPEAGVTIPLDTGVDPNAIVITGVGDTALPADILPDSFDASQGDGLCSVSDGGAVIAANFRFRTDTKHITLAHVGNTDFIAGAGAVIGSIHYTYSRT